MNNYDLELDHSQRTNHSDIPGMLTHNWNLNQSGELSTTTIWQVWENNHYVKIPIEVAYNILPYNPVYGPTNKIIHKNVRYLSLKLSIDVKYLAHRLLNKKEWDRWFKNQSENFSCTYQFDSTDIKELFYSDQYQRREIINRSEIQRTPEQIDETLDCYSFNADSIVNCLVYLIPERLLTILLQ